MNNQQIQQLATIATRLSTLNLAAKNAENALKEVRFNSLENVLTDEDIEQINKVMDILQKVSSKTNVRDAVNIFNELTNF